MLLLLPMLSSLTTAAAAAAAAAGAMSMEFLHHAQIANLGDGSRQFGAPPHVSKELAAAHRHVLAWKEPEGGPSYSEDPPHAHDQKASVN